MRYKTTIEIQTEAENEYEATDMAGEFLRGGVTEEANLKVNTISVPRAQRIKIALAISATIAVLTTLIIGNRIYYRIAKVEVKQATSYAIQPPLRTNLSLPR